MLLFIPVNKHRKYNEILSYTYYIRRKSDGLQYHGVRVHNVKLNRSPTEDFGIYYFTSGKFKKEFKDAPQNFDWKIKWTFDVPNDAVLYETKINEKLYKRKSWINYCGKYIPVESAKVGREKSLMEKYGVDHTSKIPSVINKRKLTFLTKYGVNNPSTPQQLSQQLSKGRFTKSGLEQNIPLDFNISSPLCINLLPMPLFLKSGCTASLNKNGKKSGTIITVPTTLSSLTATIIVSDDCLIFFSKALALSICS
jgi:hypothetical protein